MKWFALIALLVIGPNALACDKKEEGQLKSEFASRSKDENMVVYCRTHIEYLKLLLTDSKGSQLCHDQMVKMWGLLGFEYENNAQKACGAGPLKFRRVPRTVEEQRSAAEITRNEINRAVGEMESQLAKAK